MLPPVVLLLELAALDFLLVDSRSYRDREDVSRGALNAVLLGSGEATTFGCD